MTKGTNFNKMFKRAASVLVLVLVLVSGVIQHVYASESLDIHIFNFWLDYESGNPYDYSSNVWLTGPQNAYVEYTTGSYEFSASVVGYTSSGYITNITLANSLAYPGYITYVQSWVYQSGYSQAVIRGESTHDILYSAYGYWWMQ